MPRTILVGDIHGCPDELGDLLDRVRYAQGSDTLVLVGDLVARGPDSRGAIERARNAGAVAVRGNHDEKLLTWWRIARTDGPEQAHQAVKLSERHRTAVAQLHEEHFAWLEALPLTYELPAHSILVVHAGIDPTRALSEQDPHLLMNIRSIDEHGVATRQLTGTPWARAWQGPPHIVFGHDARRGLQIEPWATGLDTGCCYGRTLTALVLDAGEPVPTEPEARRARLVSVPARKTYCPIGDGNGPE